MKRGLMVEMRRIRELMGRLCEGVNDHDVLDKVWISYGSSSFDPNKFTTYDSALSRKAYEDAIAKGLDFRISYNDYVEMQRRMMGNRNKPIFGLWASPVDSKLGWRNFCMKERFNIEKLRDKFLFKLSPDSKIYVIDNKEDLNAISVPGLDDCGWNTIDFRKLVNDGFDGLYITEDASYIRDDTDCTPIRRGLGSWDVESICVFNKDVVIPINDESLFPDDSELESIESSDDSYYSDDFDGGDYIDDLIEILKKDESEWTEDDRRILSYFTDEEIEMTKWNLH